MLNMKYNACPKRKKDRERRIGAGRHFKLDIKNRFLMLLVYYRLSYNLHVSRLSI